MALVETFMARRPSVEEREAAGKALREKVPRASHARYQPARRPAGSGVDPRAAERDARAEARAGALCAHARVALRLPARLGGGDGRRPVGHAGDGHAGRGLRRHARLQFRRLRLGRAQSDLRHQRFRRGPSRALGMGPQATGGERRGGRALHGRRTRCRPRRRRGDRAVVPQAHPALRRDGLSRGLVRAHRRAVRARGALAARLRRSAERVLDKAREQGPRPGAREAHRARSTASTASSRTCR